MSILRLQPNQPVQIALKYLKPKEASGRQGMEFQYTLLDGHILYLPPLAHAEIKALNPAPGEKFTLLKSISNGNAAVYSVERIPQADVPELAPKPISQARSIAPAVAIPPSLTTAESRRIFTQLVATIQACQAAEEFSRSIDFSVKFGPEDIRAMAISGFIEQSRRAA